MSRGWLLNFDADEELARPEGPRRLRPSPTLACRLLRARVLLVPRGDVVLDRAPERAITRVVCWMPTRRALAAVKRLGLSAPRAPSFEILRRVNSRQFSAALGSGPPGTCFVTSETELTRVLQDGHDWLLRTVHGFAGRGRLFTRAGEEDAALRFARAALARDGGLEAAPRVRPELELALHGFVDASGAITLGTPTLSHVDAQGQWRRSSVAGPRELTRAEAGQLESAAAETAEALHQAGYFGPFGIDAFRYRGRLGPGFCARSEVNARYTMAWGRGMAGRRVDLC